MSNSKRLPLLLLTMLALCLSLLPVAMGEQVGTLSCRFLSLSTTDGSKAGDCALLVSPEGLTMLIDAGAPTAAEHLVRRLKELGVERIDYLVASHPHIDHIGGMPLVMDQLEVGCLMQGPLSYDSTPTRALEAAVRRHSIPVKQLSQGDSFRFGEQVEVDILWPAGEISYYAGYPEGSTQFINDRCLVMRIRYGDTRFLFAGDLYTQGEKAVLTSGADIACDVMKINHHGDRTSSSKAWRTAAGAKIAVATNNTITNLQVLQRFIKDGFQLYHPLLDGDILISTQGNQDLLVTTTKPRTGSFP